MLMTLLKRAFQPALVAATFLAVGMSVLELGNLYRHHFEETLGNAVLAIHVLMLVGYGAAYRYAASGQARKGTFVCLCVTSCLFASSAFLFTPHAMFGRAIMGTIRAESELIDIRSGAAMPDRPRDEQLRAAQWWKEELAIRQAKERAVTIEFQRAKRGIGSLHDLLLIWTGICAGFTLLYWWKWRGRFGHSTGIDVPLRD